MPFAKISGPVGALALCAFLTLGAVAQTPRAPAGVPNFHVVSQHIYRGGQPNATGWVALKNMGVTTVIDLCGSPAAERRAVTAAGMKFVSIPMDSIGIGEPSASKVERALEVLNQRGGIVFVHCRKGSDRTGTVIACYRIEHQHWTPARAQEEADRDGMSWINVGMKRYIAHYSAPPEVAVAAVAARQPQTSN